MSHMHFRLAVMLGLAGCTMLVAASRPVHAQSIIFSPGIGPVLSHGMLSDNDLSHIRGGFELAPGVRAYFAFSQIVKINGEVVQKIVVPQMELSSTNPVAQFSITGDSGTHVYSGANAVQLAHSSNGVQTATVDATPVSGNLKVLTNENGGQTEISTQFTDGGIANHVANVSNNAAISAATTISIATQGLAASIQAQRMESMMLANMQRNQTMSP